MAYQATLCIALVRPIMRFLTGYQAVTLLLLL